MHTRTDEDAAPTDRDMRTRPLVAGELGVKNRTMKIWDPDLCAFTEDED